VSDGATVHTLRKGDCIREGPAIKHREIACSEDFEVLEIPSPGNCATHFVAALASQGRGTAE